MFCTKHRHRKQFVTKPNPVVDPSGWNGGWDGVTPPPPPVINFLYMHC